MTFQLQFTRRFSMAHRLISGKSEKCAIPHGHNEYVTITLEAKTDVTMDHQHNMVEEFQKIKQRWHEFIDQHLDHALQLSERDPLINYFKQHEVEKLKRIVVTPGDPTTEIMCACLMAKLQTFLDNDSTKLNCVALKIEETPTNSVILQGVNVYQQHLPNSRHCWWHRADMTINDFQTS